MLISTQPVHPMQGTLARQPSTCLQTWPGTPQGARPSGLGVNGSASPATGQDCGLGAPCCSEGRTAFLSSCTRRGQAWACVPGISVREMLRVPSRAQTYMLALDGEVQSALEPQGFESRGSPYTQIVLNGKGHSTARGRLAESVGAEPRVQRPDYKLHWDLGPRGGSVPLTPAMFKGHL